MPSYLDILPKDMLSHILRFTPREDLISLRQTCRSNMANLGQYIIDKADNYETKVNWTLLYNHWAKLDEIDAIYEKKWIFYHSAWRSSGRFMSREGIKIMLAHIRQYTEKLGVIYQSLIEESIDGAIESRRASIVEMLLGRIRAIPDNKEANILSRWAHKGNTWAINLLLCLKVKPDAKSLMLARHGNKEALNILAREAGLCGDLDLFQDSMGLIDDEATKKDIIFTMANDANGLVLNCVKEYEEYLGEIAVYLVIRGNLENLRKLFRPRSVKWPQGRDIDYTQYCIKMLEIALEYKNSKPPNFAAKVAEIILDNYHLGQGCPGQSCPCRNDRYKALAALSRQEPSE